MIEKGYTKIRFPRFKAFQYVKDWEYNADWTKHLKKVKQSGVYRA
jgi:hypothetical protein